MADTRQIVSWSLERKCAFRGGDNWFLPEHTCKQLIDLRSLASAENDGRNVAGVCVTAWTVGRDDSGGIHKIPLSGFRIEDQLGGFGGLSFVLATCQECEANAQTELGIRVAGCFGYLDVRPDSKELDEQLWRVVEERNLEQQLRLAFRITTPLWYGLWINSPLRKLQAECLHELLSPICDEPEDKDIHHFLSALTAAIRWELPVHVSLFPLGHTDLGWYTVFPHCPRCKANALVGRWKVSYQQTPYECQVCGHGFIPDEHHSQERLDFDWDARSLVKQLGKTGYDEFVKTFLRHRGCSSEQASQIMENRKKLNR